MVRSLTAALAAALSVAFALPASAERADASAFTCKEFTEALASTDKDTAYGGVVLLSWMAGYHATEDQGTVVDFDTLKKDGDKVIDFCAKSPGIGLMSASAKFMGENATPVTREAVDIATLKCAKLAQMDPNKDAEGAGVVLMWLAGYYAAENDDTMIDFDALEQHGTEIGETCAASQEMGLVTAAKKSMQVE